jgi:hypothetical protein
MEDDFLAQIKGREVDLVVCSDAEAILGIGDQGVGVSYMFQNPLAWHLMVDWYLKGHRRRILVLSYYMVLNYLIDIDSKICHIYVSRLDLLRSRTST